MRSSDSTTSSRAARSAAASRTRSGSTSSRPHSNGSPTAPRWARPSSSCDARGLRELGPVPPGTRSERLVIAPASVRLPSPLLIVGSALCQDHRMDRFETKVVVVTGAASGIGRALVEAWLREGCRVVMADVEVPALTTAHERLDPGLRDRAIAVHTDVSDAASVHALADATIDAFGQVDIVCNNAGVSTFNTFEHQTLADWQWVLGVNLWGVIHGVHTFVPIMRKQPTPAHVVNTASIAGLLSGIAYIGVYAASKTAVVSISETLRQELEIEGAPIGVSVLCPSATDTDCMEGERNRPAAT